MKAKTRILALLLTVLMVAGMLPLALFAAAGDTPAEAIQSGAADRTLESIKSTLESSGLDLYVYQSFENIEDSKFTNGVLTLPLLHRGEWVNIDENSVVETGIDFVGGFGKAGKNPFECKHYRGDLSIRQEGDNNALYFGNGALVGNSNDDTWFDIETDAVSTGSDLLISVDFKMDGKTVNHAQDGNTLLTIITRNAKGTDLGRTDIKILGLTYDGGIFLWDNDKRTEIVGYLSDTAYTRVAVETDVRNNKYYVYLNDVLVNPNGCQLISDTVLKHIREGKGVADFAYTDLNFAEARVYTIDKDNRPDNYQINTSTFKDTIHDGMWIDNILLAGRAYLAAGNSMNANIYTMDLSGVTVGESAAAKEENGTTVKRIPGTSDFGTDRYAWINGATSKQSESSVVYYEEADGSISIQHRYPTVKNDGADAIANDGTQNYMQLSPLATQEARFIGQNLILGGYFRAGSETVKQTNILAPISRTKAPGISATRQDLYGLYYDGARILKFKNGSYTVTLGTVPTDRFMKIEVHVICNTYNDKIKVKIYLDDVMTYSADIADSVTAFWTGASVAGQTLKANTPFFCDMHITQLYGNHYMEHSADDMHIKDVFVGYTDKYNDTYSAMFNPFAKNVNGFVTAGGVTRYVENGMPKTEDFTLGGETYKVGQGGAILGKYSDGVTQTPYAPYVDWDHSGSLMVNEPLGARFHGNSGTMALGRYAYVKDGFETAQGTAALYSSFLAPSAYTGDTNSYYDYGLGANKNNANLVLDFDLKLGQKSGHTDVLMLNTRTDPNGSGSSGNANRGDTYILRISGGWLTYGNRKIVKLSDTEFTRISFALKTPDAAESVAFVSNGAPTYTETGRAETTYTPEEFAALGIVAQDKTPVYDEANIAYRFSSAATSVSEVVDGKRTVVHAGTGTVSGTYTEVIVENITDNDVESVKVTEITGTVTRADNYNRTTVYTLDGSYSLYVNGVQMVEEALIYTDEEGFVNDDASTVESLRMFQCKRNSAVYVKDYYVYQAEKPQQYYTMDGGSLSLTSDGTPVKASDIKKGFVTEDGVLRYYDELGLPMINTTFTADDGNEYTANANGKLVCDGSNHIPSDNGICVSCGEKLDGVTALYGTSLVLGTDVKVVFYLDVDTAILGDGAYLEVGLYRDYANGTTEKFYLNGDDYAVEIGGQTYYKVSFAVSGKDICSDVIVTPKTASGAQGTVYTYSAADYAEDVQKLPTDAVYTEELKALANALVVYGKNAAAVLAGGEAAETIGEVDFSTVANASGNPDINVGAIKLNKFSLELKSNIKLKVYFSFDEYNMMGYTWEEYAVTVNSESAEPELVDEENKIYCIEIDVVAAKLGETVAITVLHYLDGGLELNISPLYYAKVMVASGKASEAEINLMKAIKLYADAAVAYAEGTAEDSRPAV